MKTKQIAWVMVVLFSVSLQLNAQFSEKKEVPKEENGGNSLEDGAMDKTTFNTSRLEDIQQLEVLQKRLQIAVDAKSGIEAEVYKNHAFQVMTNEIARSKKNLNELKAGNTEHLDAYQAEHAPNYPINVSREIQTLTNRTNYEYQVYKRLKSLDLTKNTDSRDFTSAPGYLNAFKSAMQRNLRYESDEKTTPIPGGGPGSHGGGTVEGSGVITKKGSSETIDEGDPRIQSWLGSKSQRKSEFMKNQSDFQTYAGKNDNKMAKRSYQALLQLMMDEINASRWMIGQVNAGNINKESVDTEVLVNNVNKQQAILTEAKSVSVSFPDDLKANKGKATELIKKFAATL